MGLFSKKKTREDETLITHNGKLAQIRVTIGGLLQMKYYDSQSWFYPDQVWDEFSPESLRIIADLKEDYIKTNLS